MGRTLVLLAVAAATILPIAGCSDSPPITMPNVVGKHLDVALSDVQRAGVHRDVDVVGGGLFGIVDKSNWTVCTQDPASGAAVSGTPRVTVERTCESSPGPRPSSEAAPQPSASSAPEATEEDSADMFEPTAKYGQTLKFKAYQTCCPGDPMKLDITVSAPKPFKPADPADAKQAVNVYFTVTMKNTGTTEASPSGLVEVYSGRRSAEDGIGTEGDQFFNTDDGFSGPGDLPVGKSSAYRVGFSVADAKDLILQMSPYGLGGATLTWEP